MEKRQSENRKINRRYRRAAGRIWENSSLRDELNDDQARRLLNWGSDHLKKAANETAELPDEVADNILQAQTELVSGLIRQVNRLTGAITKGDQQEISEHLQSLKESLEQLLDETGHLTTDFERWGAMFEGDSAKIFDQLMTLLDGEEE